MIYEYKNIDLIFQAFRVIVIFYYFDNDNVDFNILTLIVWGGGDKPNLIVLGGGGPPL